MRLGYKQTDVGVIPVEWELGDLHLSMTYTHGKAHEPFVAEWGKYTIVNSKFIATEGAVKKVVTSNFCPAQQGDVLMVLSDLPNGRALAKTYTAGSEASMLAVNQRVVRLRPNPMHCDGSYAGYAINRHPYFLKFDDGVTQTHLLNKHLDEFKFPLPPIKEQQAIAEVLSDVDAEIGEAKKLLAKKIRLKTGLERQLLTDDGSWVKRRFSDLLSFEQPQKYLVEATQISETGEIPVLTPGKTFILGYCSSGVVGVDNQDSIECIVFDDFTTASKFVDFSFRLRSSAVKVLRAKDDVTHTRALEALLRKVRYKPEDHKRHWISQFQHFEVSVPDSLRLSEISLTIRDIDNEISSLEALIRRSQAKKEGLMQTLLTGKIRLT